VSNDLVKSNDRQKLHGEVYTPRFLVLRMLDLIPEDRWRDPKEVFLEPSCGNGNFIVEILRKRLQSGIDLETALKTCYGIDIQPDNIVECHKRVTEMFIGEHPDRDRLTEILKARIICGNFLERAELWE